MPEYLYKWVHSYSGRFRSMNDSLPNALRMEYEIGKEAWADRNLFDRGYGLCVFCTVDQAKLYAEAAARSASSVVLLRCTYRGKLWKPKVNFMDYAGDENLYNCKISYGTPASVRALYLGKPLSVLCWPYDTMMVERLTPIEVVTW